jgi:serine/alanine adding enzyme
MSTVVETPLVASAGIAVNSASPTVRIADASDGDRWQAFVARHPESTSYHAWAWQTVFEKAFGWRGHYLLAEQNGEVCGVLPLIWQRNWPVTSVLSSVPHMKGGGILADSVEAAESLLAEAQQLALRLKAGALELRHASNPESCAALTMRTDKVTFTLGLEREEEKMLKALDKKTRNMVKKSQSFGMTAEFDTAGSLDEFYKIFCLNMRELGSPVYSRKFLAAIQEAFPGNVHICLVRHQGAVIAGAFLFGFRGTVEAIWASSLYKYLDLKPNMFMYWNMFRFASERGYDTFDFGRCSIGSGTYRFKMQWGAQEVPLYWHQWRADGTAIPAPKSASPALKLVSQIWQRTPLAVTNLVGPQLIKYLEGV